MGLNKFFKKKSSHKNNNGVYPTTDGKRTSASYNVNSSIYSPDNFNDVNPYQRIMDTDIDLEKSICEKNYQQKTNSNGKGYIEDKIPSKDIYTNIIVHSHTTNTSNSSSPNHINQKTSSLPDNKIYTLQNTSSSSTNYKKIYSPTTNTTSTNLNPTPSYKKQMNATYSSSTTTKAVRPILKRYSQPTPTNNHYVLDKYIYPSFYKHTYHNTEEKYKPDYPVYTNSNLRHSIVMKNEKRHSTVTFNTTITSDNDSIFSLSSASTTSSESSNANTLTTTTTNNSSSMMSYDKSVGDLLDLYTHSTTTNPTTTHSRVVRTNTDGEQNHHHHHQHHPSKKSNLTSSSSSFSSSSLKKKERSKKMEKKEDNNKILSVYPSPPNSISSSSVSSPHMTTSEMMNPTEEGELKKKKKSHHKRKTLSRILLSGFSANEQYLQTVQCPDGYFYCQDGGMDRSNGSTNESTAYNDGIDLTQSINSTPVTPTSYDYRRHSNYY